ncbi:MULTISPECIES: hypothetical protein [Bradyrhizobium]|uniref:Uncharacterized protein n=1 Tax=Bradyrhizobium septentrionale TaxID=1404411 RepID=A0ABZ2PAQ2_9BRAD
MSNDLIRRLEALEARINAERPAGPGAPMRVVIISGALPPGEPLFANTGEHELLRNEGEELDAFVARAVAEAHGLAVPLLTIGGLPQSEGQTFLAQAAFEKWLASGADDVPPVTQPGTRR